MIDLATIRRFLRMRTVSESEVSDVNLARHFVEDVRSATGAAPVTTRGMLYVYDKEDGVWRELKREEVLSLIQAYDGITIGCVKTNHKTGETADYTRPLRFKSGVCKGIYECVMSSQDVLDLEFFDDAPRGVAFQNGFVSVGPGGEIVFVAKSPEHRALTAMPFDFDRDAESPEFIAALRRVFDGDHDAEDKRKLLQEFVGACLLGRATEYAACLVLVGEGANGKSVIAETIAERLFPADAVTYTAPQSWSGRFTLSRLRNARLNVASELPDAEIASSDVFKAVVDGGQWEVERKGVDGYSMKPRAGHLFLANALPSTSDNSRGFWRRFLVVEFNRDFSKDPAQETKEAVKARIAGEAPGIMLWALHGAARLLKAGKYTVPASHYKAVRDWRVSADQVAAFVDECCEPCEPETPARDVYAAFREWCSKVGRKDVSNNTFGRRLKSLGVTAKATKFGMRYGLEILPKSDWDTGKVKAVKVGEGSFSEPSPMQLSAEIEEFAAGEGGEGFSRARVYGAESTLT